MRKVYNFSAGPAMLPEEVLLNAQAEMLDWHDTGMSIMELGHRGSDFKALADKSEHDLRELMNIPEDYHVLFLPGGASAQFAMVPLNLFSSTAEVNKADYVDTGIWSKKAIAEAKRYGDVHLAAKTEIQNGLISIPKQKDWHIREDIQYLHYTPNETIEGIEFNWIPETGKIPLIADMSSMILSRPIDVARYGIIYAGAQKNLGQAGITVVIIRDDLIQSPLMHTPTLYQYQVQADNHSFYNTPPTYAWYITSLMLEWMKRQGGVQAFHAINQRKAGKLYAYIDKHKDFYRNTIHRDDRSMMNVVFDLPHENLTKRFLAEAQENALTNLGGHRVVGGVRASIYNAMPEEGVDTLIQFMDAFLKRNG